MIVGTHSLLQVHNRPYGRALNAVRRIKVAATTILDTYFTGFRHHQQAWHQRGIIFGNYRHGNLDGRPKLGWDGVCTGYGCPRVPCRNRTADNAHHANMPVASDVQFAIREISARAIRASQP